MLNQHSLELKQQVIFKIPEDFPDNNPNEFFDKVIFHDEACKKYFKSIADSITIFYCEIRNNKYVLARDAYESYIKFLTKNNPPEKMMSFSNKELIISIDKFFISDVMINTFFSLFLKPFITNYIRHGLLKLNHEYDNFLEHIFYNIISIRVDKFGKILVGDHASLEDFTVAEELNPIYKSALSLVLRYREDLVNVSGLPNCFTLGEPVPSLRRSRSAVLDSGKNKLTKQSKLKPQSSSLDALPSLESQKLEGKNLNFHHDISKKKGIFNLWGWFNDRLKGKKEEKNLVLMPPEHIAKNNKRS